MVGKVHTRAARIDLACSHLSRWALWQCSKGHTARGTQQKGHTAKGAWLRSSSHSREVQHGLHQLPATKHAIGKAALPGLREPQRGGLSNAGAGHGWAYIADHSH